MTRYLRLVPTAFVLTVSLTNARANNLSTPLPAPVSDEIFSATAMVQIGELLATGKVRGLEFGFPITAMEVVERVEGKRLRYKIETGGGWCGFETLSEISVKDNRRVVTTIAYRAVCQS